MDRLFKLATSRYILTDVSVAEIVWVLESLYKVPKSDIVAKLRLLLALEAIEADKTLLSDALDFYWSRNIDFIDAYLAAYASTHHIDAVVSYDRDLDKIAGISREEP